MSRRTPQIAALAGALVLSCPCATAQTLGYSGTPALGQTITFVTTGPAGSPYLLGLATTPGPSSLPPLPPLAIGQPFTVLVGPSVSSPFFPAIGSSGIAEFPVQVPLALWLYGQSFYLQSAYVDPTNVLGISLTNGINFTISSPAVAPLITGIVPATGGAVGGTTVTINGSNFQPGATSVMLGGQPLGNLQVSPTSITGTTPPGTPGPPVDLVVTTTVGTAHVLGAFTYLPGDPPSIISIVPDHAPVGGGTLITITGSGLGVGTTIFIGGIALMPVAQTSSQVIGVAPAINQVGFAVVAAASALGILNLPSAFRYTIALDTGNGSVGPFTPATNTVLDTTTNLGVFNFTEVSIPAGVQVLVQGPNPLRIKCLGDVTITGQLVLDGQPAIGASGGAGGPAGGAGGDAGSGGPGGGHPGDGPGGGASNPTGNGGSPYIAGPGSFGEQGYFSHPITYGYAPGGTPYGNSNLEPLLGGSGGGGTNGMTYWCNPCSYSPGSAGGGGGGATSITAGGWIRVWGAVSCRGGNAASNTSPAGTAAIGGPGSGGAVRLGSQGSIQVTGTISTAGGTVTHPVPYYAGIVVAWGGSGRWYVENWLGQTWSGGYAVATGIY